MNITMTIAEIDREIARLREERTRTLARLRSPDGGGRLPRRGPAGSSLTPSMLIEDIDREIERLRARRRRAVARLRDPAESAKRRVRRGAALARWVETGAVTSGQMKQVRALADGEDRGLFAEEALVADGWRRDAQGHWHGPVSPGACEGPVTDVVVLAQARADVDASLALDIEGESPTASGLVAVDDECDDSAPPAPEGFDDAVSFDAEAAAAFDREFAALAEAFAEGEVVDPYAERVQARAREIVAERVAAAWAAKSTDGQSG